MRRKIVQGFQTGDLVIASVPTGKYKGLHQGRVAVRARGSFVIQTRAGNIETHSRHCKLVMRNDGYTYTKKESAIARPCNADIFLA